MKKIRSLLPSLFRREALANQASKPDEQLSSIPVFEFKDLQQAAQFHNVLALQVPSEALAAMAFDDYYPAFYFALNRFEQARNSGASKDNEARVQIGNFDNLPALPNQSSVLDKFYALQKELHASIKVDANGNCTDLDQQRFMTAIFENLDILSAMKTAMNAPIKNIPQIRDTALVDPAQPLKADLVTNRYGRAYSEEYLEEFLAFIQWAEENAPHYAAQKIGADIHLGICSPQ